MGYRVTGEFAAVTTGEPGSNGVVQILERGAVVPEGVHQSVLDHLVSVGQIERSDDEVEGQAEESGAPDDEAELVRLATEDLMKLDLNELRALAAEQQVDLSGRTKKAEIVEALVASTAPAGD